MQVYCLSSFEAFGLVKIPPCYVENVGHERLFRVPITNKAWEHMDFEGQFVARNPSFLACLLAAPAAFGLKFIV